MAHDSDKPRYAPHDASMATEGAANERTEICVDVNETQSEGWRQVVGRQVVNVQHTVDANLSLFRLGCIFVMAGSAYAAVRLSGVLARLNHVDEIPAYYFRQRKSIRVRMVCQNEQDPSVFYVYHTPFLRRVLLRDTLPKDTWSTDKDQPLLTVRAFGIQVDECANEWIWSNVVASHRYMTLTLLHRMNTEMPGHESIVTCAMVMDKLPLAKDFAHELVSQGLAECLPEYLDKYDDGSGQAVQPLLKRLQQLEAAQKHAQTMQYGIWKDWQDEKLSDRVVSAGKRVTTRGWQKLVGKVTGSE